MRKMLTGKFLFSVVAWQIIASLGAFSQVSYQIKANITGLGDRSVVIRYTRQGLFMTDTVKAAKDQFSHSMIMTDGGIATLQLSPLIQLTFWLEPPLISITGSLKPPVVLRCTGTPENNLLELYRRTIERPYAVRKQGKSYAEADPITLREHQATREFIKQHPTTSTAAYMLYWQAVYDTTIFKQLEQLLAGLSPSIKNNYWAQKAVTRIYNVQNRPKVGRKLPAFSIPSSTGQLVSLDAFKGKYILIDFWGTWCVPCIQGIPELKDIHSKYGDRLAIISIALEQPTDRDKWLKAIKKYKMIWTQTAEFTSAKDGINELYNIREYPTFLLADPEGILLAKLKYGESMDKQIHNLLKK